MDHKFSVSTQGTVTVGISTSCEENCMVNEKTYNKSLTVKDLKQKFEVFGANANTMKIKVFGKDDKFMFELDSDEKLLGSYPVDSGMRLHIEDAFLMRRMLCDDSNVEKFELTEEDYEKRDGTSGVAQNSSQVSAPRGRGRGILKDNMERLQSVKVKQLRRPGVKSVTSNTQQSDTDNSSDIKSNYSDVESSRSSIEVRVVKPLRRPDNSTIGVTGNDNCSDITSSVLPGEVRVRKLIRPDTNYSDVLTFMPPAEDGMRHLHKPDAVTLMKNYLGKQPIVPPEEVRVRYLPPDIIGATKNDSYSDIMSLPPDEVRVRKLIRPDTISATGKNNSDALTFMPPGEDGVSCLPRPDTVTIGVTENDKCSNLKSDSDQSKKPTLNPDAAVFIPREIYNDPDLVSSADDITCAIPIIDPKTGLPIDLGNEDYDYDDNDNDDDFQVVVNAVSKAALLSQEDGAGHVKYEREVHDLLDLIHQQLSCNPGLYLCIMKAMEPILCRWCGFSGTLDLVANKLVQQGAVKNYAYLSARMCAELDKVTSTLGVHPLFRSNVLNECEKIHKELPDMLKRRQFERAHGTITCLSELFVQLTLKGQTRITMLGMAVMSSLDMLLANPYQENIVCLCKILKLCGWALDNDIKDEMGKFLGRLVATKLTHKFDALIDSMLDNVVSLAGQQWGRGSTNATATSSTPTTPTSNSSKNCSEYNNGISNSVSDEPATFTEDELKFLNDNFKITLDSLGMSESDCEELVDEDDDDDDDGMDDEACAAFEEFLSTMPNSNRNSTSNFKRNG